MKQSKDPFEVALEEHEESPPESPSAPDEIETQTPTVMSSQGDDVGTSAHPSIPSTTTGETVPIGTTGLIGKSKKEDEEEEEENMEIELGKFPTSGDPDKMAKMHQNCDDGEKTERANQALPHQEAR